MDSPASGAGTSSDEKYANKRKTNEIDSAGPSKRPRAGKWKGKQKDASQEVWPEYFNSLFKVFKALNTVLAFVSSRKHLATTFPVVRTSVEALLKQPLEMSKVAELKALLPDLVKFAYIPQNQLRIHGDSSTVHDSGSKKRRDRSPDFSAFASGVSSGLKGISTEDEDEVLVLEFAENSKGKKNANPGFSFTTPPSLTPAALKKLVEKRNERFSAAVDELIRATPESEDPVLLLQSAGHDHLPVNPSAKTSSKAFSEVKEKGDIIIPDSKDRPSVDAVLTEIQEQLWYKCQIAHRRTVEEKPGQLAELDPPLSGSITQALKDSRKISSLYSHQVTAITALDEGKNVIVSTSTASGKSVIYQVPMLRFLEHDRDSTAIFIYPTKALAQDQRAALEQLLFSCPGLEHIRVATYDGDTPADQRHGIRDTASVIFTNFDMIHASILPHEELWRRFLKNLKLVAVDELHYYSGSFGSHVAQIMRRLRRVCAAVGNRHSQFVSCSATISNPKQHMKNMFGVDNIVEVTEDGAPSGRKDYVVWDPPYIDSRVPSLGKHSSMSEATGLMRFLMKRGIRVILFCKYRKACELAMKTLRNDLAQDGRLDILERTMSYRGGYSQEDRRRIEHEAFSGNLLGIIATNALELGVDIGVLDAVIMLGFPIGLASFRQQAGRAGRRARDSLAVFVAEGLPIDQHYVQNPEELFDKSVDELVVDLENKVILEAHLQCAALEMPLSLEDDQYFGPMMRELLNTRLSKDKEGWYHTHPKFMPFPAKYISIRGTQEEKYALIDISKAGEGGLPSILEEVEISRAQYEVYEGAVFIHQGLTYIVKELSHDTKIAKVIRADVNWITSPRDYTDVDASQTLRIREIKKSPHRAFYGRVEVQTRVFGFFKIRDKMILDAVDIDVQPWEHETTGLWLDIPGPILAIMRNKGIAPSAAIHAAQHAFLNRFAMGADLGTECKAPEKENKVTESKRKRPARLIFYDSVGKSGGVAANAFDHVSAIMSKTCDVLEACDCTEGCANCCQSPSCTEKNAVCSKMGAIVILRGILDLAIDVDSISIEGTRAPPVDTIVNAAPVRIAEGVQVEVDPI